MRRLWLITVLTGGAAKDAFPWLAPLSKIPEREPPTPEEYAEKDAAWRTTHANLSRAVRPDTDDPLIRLKYEQFMVATCHSVAHQLGRRIFADNVPGGGGGGVDDAAAAAIEDALDAALEACEYRCTGGCLHGAVGAYAVARRRRDARYSLDIPRLCARPAMAAVLGVGECAHAAGHALAQIGVGDDEALAHCDGASDANPSLAHYCAGGVVMERGPRFFGKVPPEEKCPTVAPGARAACFYFGLRNSATGGDLAPVAARCPAAPASVRRACVYGAASSASKNRMHMVDGGVAGARACEALDAPVRPACVDGLMFRTGKYGVAGFAAAACGAFRDADLRRLCGDVGAAGMYTLRKDALVASYAR